MPSSTTSTRRLPRRKPTSSSGTSGWIALRTRSGIAVRPRVSARPSTWSPRSVVFQRPPCMTVPTMVLVEPVLDDVTLRRRQPLLELLRLHLVGERWQVDALEAEARLTERREHADLRSRVVPAAERAAHVAGADADREEDGLVARLGEAEALFHEARERLEAVARVEQRKRRLQRGRVCALLEDRGALAVVLADHDDRAADDAGGGDVRERVGGDVIGEDYGEGASILQERTHS